MSEPHANLCVLHCLGMLLSLTQDGAQLELELALHVHLLHPLRNANVFEKVGLVNYRNSLLKVYDALFKHAQFLEAHSHIMVCDISEVTVSLAMLEIDHL